MEVLAGKGEMVETLFHFTKVPSDLVQMFNTHGLWANGGVCNGCAAAGTLQACWRLCCCTTLARVELGPPSTRQSRGADWSTDPQSTEFYSGVITKDLSFMEMTWDLADVEQLGMQVTGEFGHQHDVPFSSWKEAKWLVSHHSTSSWDVSKHSKHASLAKSNTLQWLFHVLKSQLIPVLKQFRTYMWEENRTFYHSVDHSQMMGISSQVLGFLTDLRALGNGLSEQSYGIQR